MYPEELKRMLDDEVCRKEAAGVQLLVFSNDEEIFYYSSGYTNIEKHILPGRDTIYRIYSMTKPITSVVASILCEQKMLDPSKDLSYYLPEFSNITVLVNGEMRKPQRPITINDLLNMTSGIVYPDNDEAGRIMGKIFDDIGTHIINGCQYSTREVINKISQCPVAFQPGSQWRYGLSADVLAGVFEVVMGKTLDAIYKELVFEPLEMKDTAFYVPEENRNRLSVLYKKQHGGFVEDKHRHLGLTTGMGTPMFLSGGAGLYSTINDYSHFLAMLCNDGIYNKKQIISGKIISGFEKNMLTEQQMKTVTYLPHMAGYGYGHLMRVFIGGKTESSSGRNGEFGWDGWTGPYFSVDCKSRTFVLYMTQVSGYSHWDFIWNMRDEVFSR